MPKSGRTFPFGLTAFGETKTLLAWSKDPRCTVSYPTIRKRVLAGVPVELAITAGKMDLIPEILTQEQLDYIWANCDRMSSREIAHELGVKRSLVRSYLDRQPQPLDLEVIEELIDYVRSFGWPGAGRMGALAFAHKKHAVIVYEDEAVLDILEVALCPRTICRYSLNDRGLRKLERRKKKIVVGAPIVSTGKSMVSR